MGDFRVMAQAKGVEDGVELLGFSPESPLRKGTPTELGLRPAPLLASEHLDLMAGRYPHLAREWGACGRKVKGKRALVTGRRTS